MDAQRWNFSSSVQLDISRVSAAFILQLGMTNCTVYIPHETTRKAFILQSGNASRQHVAMTMRTLLNNPWQKKTASMSFLHPRKDLITLERLTVQCCHVYLFFISSFLSSFLLIFNDSDILVKWDILALPSFRVRRTNWSSSVLLITDRQYNHYWVNLNSVINVQTSLDTSPLMPTITCTLQTTYSRPQQNLRTYYNINKQNGSLISYNTGQCSQTDCIFGGNNTQVAERACGYSGLNGVLPGSAVQHDRKNTIRRFSFYNSWMRKQWTSYSIWWTNFTRSVGR